MRKIECLSSLFLLAFSSCFGGSIATIHEIQPRPASEIAPREAPPREIPPRYQIHLNPSETHSIDNAAASATGKGAHVDGDVRDGHLIFTPDQSVTHLGASGTTITTGSGKTVPLVLSPAAKQFMQEHKVN